MTQPASRPTYAELAKAAGVSEATVSRVLNGDERVHPDRAKRVHNAVEKLGYRRNRVAAALASGKTGLIAIVIEDDLGVFGDPFWATVSSGISRVLMDNELQTLLLVSPVNKVHGPVARYLEGGEVDGAIFFQMHRDALVKTLTKQGLPVVIVGSPHTESALTYVDTDQRAGAEQAVRHLFTSGCSRVATITGDTGATAGALRLSGYLNVCKEFDFDPGRQYVVHGDYSFESGKQAMIKLLALKHRPQGVFVANDLMAAGALSAIDEAGFTCPEDFRIVGFDDSVIAETTRPALTTVRQDIVGLGETAARLIIEKLQGREPAPVMLAAELVVRDSA